MPNILETFDLIDSLAELPEGWNFGEGVAACSISLQQSQDVLRFAFDLGHKEADAFPGIDGEIQVCFYNEDDTLEITSEIDGTVSITVEKNDETVLFREKVAFTDAIKILKDFTYNKCRSYVLSTSASTIIGKRSGYQVWHLDPQQQTKASPLSIKSVPSKQQKIYASTLRSSTLRLRELPLSSGKYQVSKFPRSAEACRA
jgi:hypothetical protein